MAKLDSIGVIETVGLAAAIECADAAVKSANVELLGYELSKGGGMVTVKISGNVAAVQAGVSAGTLAAAKVGKVVSKIIIPRPHYDLDKIILSKENVPPIEEKEEIKEKGSGELIPEPISEIIETDEDFTEITALDDDLEDLKDDSSSEDTEDNSGEESELETLETTVVETEETSRSATCNICNDPQCPRQKGEPHVNCIHYKGEKK